MVGALGSLSTPGGLQRRPPLLSPDLGNSPHSPLLSTMAPLASSGSLYPAASPPLPLGSAHPHSHPHPGRASQMIAKGLSQRRGLHMTAAPAAQGWGQLEVEAHSRGDPIRNSPSKPSSAHCPLCKKKKKKGKVNRLPWNSEAIGKTKQGRGQRSGLQDWTRSKVSRDCATQPVPHARSTVPLLRRMGLTCPTPPSPGLGHPSNSA